MKRGTGVDTRETERRGKAELILLYEARRAAGLGIFDGEPVEDHMPKSGHVYCSGCGAVATFGRFGNQRNGWRAVPALTGQKATSSECPDCAAEWDEYHGSRLPDFAELIRRGVISGG